MTADPHPPAAPRRALLLANPASGGGQRSLDAAVERLRDDGVEVTVKPPASREDIGRLIEAHAGAVDCVIVAGGDGSLNAAAAALMRTGLPLGVLPTGTANDLARTLGLPTDLPAAAAVIAAGHASRVDLGLVNDLPFFNVASIGLSADLADRLSGESKKRWGRLSYAWAALRVLTRARAFGAVIVTRDRRVRVRTYQIAVGNGRYYGGGVVVRHDARIDDGRLDLSSLEVSGVWKLALLAPAFRRGAHGAWREVRDESCTRFEVQTRTPRPVNLDGELLATTPARFELRPAAISIYTPRPDRPGAA